MPNEKKIKTVIFDLGNVLIGFNHRIAAQRLSEVCPYSVEEIYELIFDSQVVWQYETGKLKTKKFYEKMKQLLGLKLGFGKFLKIWNEIFFPKPEVEEVVKGLKKRFRLILLSNINASHYNYIRKRFPIIKKFDRIVLSYRVGARKPQLKIYQAALSAARARPEEIIYIDDRKDLVNEACDLGIHSVQFKTARGLKKQLSRFGIDKL